MRYRADLKQMQAVIGYSTIALEYLEDLPGTCDVKVCEINSSDYDLKWRDQPLPVAFKTNGIKGIGLNLRLPLSQNILLFQNVKTRLMFEIIYSCAMAFIELAYLHMKTKT